jgi:hypothetical protein
MLPPRRIRTMAALLIVAVLGTVFVVAPQPVRADANAPRWTQGDFWLYVDASNPNHTRRFEVVARETTRTLRGSLYDAWHVRDTNTVGSLGVTTDVWIRDEDLGIVNSSVTIGVLWIFTYEPPQSEALFPLSAQKSWSINVNASLKIGGGGVNTGLTTVSAEVDGEADITVPAGTFHSYAIRSLGGGTYTKFYYSDQAGYYSKREIYTAQDQKTEEMDLSNYRYQWSTTFLLIIVGLVLLAAVVIAAVVIVRRRRRATPPGAPPPPPPPTE